MISSPRIAFLSLLLLAPLSADEGGIQWFAVWEQARAEASRTGRPILLFSAAPQCHGVPGIW